MYYGDTTERQFQAGERERGRDEGMEGGMEGDSGREGEMEGVRERGRMEERRGRE